MRVPTRLCAYKLAFVMRRENALSRFLPKTFRAASYFAD
jgi:hypothetical protein